jgi:hypothetical protein
MCEIKEPQFWCEDLKGLQVVHTLEEYLALFAEANDDHRIVGEASAMYLYSQVAFKRIKEFAPESYIIVMVRNPVDLVYSYYHELLYSGNETARDFETAWRLQEVRKEGRQIPRKNQEPKILQYGALGKLSLQIERLFSIFPRERVKIVVFDDLVRSAGDVYRDVLAFLGVPDDGRRSFPAAKQAKHHRFLPLGQALTNPSPALYRLHRRLKALLGVEKTGIAKKLAVKGKPRPLGEESRGELNEYFREEVQRLSEIVGRDLSYWISPEGT